MLSRGDNNRPLKDWLHIFAASPPLRARLYRARVEKMWEDTMGALVRQYTSQIWLDGQTLLIRVSSASLKAELLLMKDTIRDRANERIGEDFVTEVRIL